LNRDKVIIIDVKDVIALTTKTAVISKEFAKMSDHMDTIEDEVIVYMLDNYEENFTNQEELDELIKNEVNFFNSVETATYPPMDIVNIIEKNDVKVIYLIDTDMPQKDKFELWVKDELKGSILLDSSDFQDGHKVDFVISANPKLLSRFSSKVKILVDMPYNKEERLFNRVGNWKGVLQKLKEEGLDMSNVAKGRFK